MRERNLNILSEAPKRHKIDSSTLEYDDYTLEGKKGPNLLSNDSKVNLEVKEPSHKISESFSEDSTIDFKTSERSHIPSAQTEAQSNKIYFGQDFRTGENLHYSNRI